MKINDNIPEIICIYKITNLKTNRILIGSTRNLHKRIIQYKYDIIHQRTNAINKRFLIDLLDESLNILNIEILEEFDENISDIVLKNKETEYIKNYNSLDETVGYNIRLDNNGKYICNLSTKLLKHNQLKEQWNSGIRDNHSNNMKNYWKNVSNDRIKQQSEIMSKNLTRFIYTIYDIKGNLIKENIYYKELCKIVKSKNITSLFCQKEKYLNKNNKNIIRIPCYKIKYCNKYIIERKYINKN